MRFRHMAMCTALAASLAAQENVPGFGWIGFRAGTLSFDPQEHLKAASHLGGQGGLVFNEQRYGFSLEVLSSHPVSQSDPATKLAHNEVSVTFLSGLAGDALGRFWPYLGLGLGGVTVALNTPAMTTAETQKATALHASLGFMHRPGAGLIWGAEGRYIVTFTSKDRKDLQASAMLGFTWGGPRAIRTAVPPPAPAPVPPPPVPVEETVQPPPAPVAAAPAPPVQTPAAQVPPPVVEAPPPAPAPAREPEAALPPPPPPPPPPPVLAPVPAKAEVAEEVVVAPGGSSVEERLNALRRGDMPKALDLGRKRIQAIPARHWTIRLEIANLSATLANAVKAFPTGKPDLFIAPIRLKGGKTSYQLFLGDYPTQAEAERAGKSVPAFFLEGGQRPKPFLGTGIPAQ